MEEKNDMDKFDDVMLPGFRFHPTDEELVDFYLKRKIQQKSLPIELIKQVDIYKYDPWDLPKLTSNGEKEWYFYCPRDRKYRNSARPNRVTRAGFWKATGTDRPIYSSEGKCIGLKKSLVFYRGRAAKGIKTDWMMHEFRLPTMADSAPPKKPLDKSLPSSDSWAICRIFKKTNSMSMTQKALSHPWITQLPESMVSDILNQGANFNQFSSENMSCTTEIGSSSAIQFCGTKDLHQVPSSTNFQASDIPSYNPINSMTVSKSVQFPVSNGELPDNFIFSTLEGLGPSSKCGVDASSMIFNTDCIGLEGPNMEQYSGFSVSVPQDMQGNMRIETGEEEQGGWKKNIPNAVQAMGFPFSLPPNIDANWKPTPPWDSAPCPSEMSSSYSTHKCYT